MEYLDKLINLPYLIPILWAACSILILLCIRVYFKQQAQRKKEKKLRLKIMQQLDKQILKTKTIIETDDNFELKIEAIKELETAFENASEAAMKEEFVKLAYDISVKNLGAANLIEKLYLADMRKWLEKNTN